MSSFRIERTMFDKMKQLTEASVTQAMKGILTRGEIRAMLKRRDAIVAAVEKQIAERRRGRGVLYFVANAGAVIVTRRPSS